MANSIIFTLDGKLVTAADDETIWESGQARGHQDPASMPCRHARLSARRQLPRLHGRCRGERVVAASCIRKPSAGMVVKTDTERARKSREMVFELLASNMRPVADSPDQQAMFWQWAGSMGISGDRYSSKFLADDVPPDSTSPIPPLPSISMPASPAGPV